MFLKEKHVKFVGKPEKGHKETFCGKEIKKKARLVKHISKCKYVNAKPLDLSSPLKNVHTQKSLEFGVKNKNEMEKSKLINTSNKTRGEEINAPQKNGADENTKNISDYKKDSNKYINLGAIVSNVTAERSRYPYDIDSDSDYMRKKVIMKSSPKEEGNAKTI